MSTTGSIDGKGRRIALALVACALLMRMLVPGGWMPAAHAQGVTLNWCSYGASDTAQAEAHALLAGALDEKSAPQEKPAPEQPCAFAAAAAALSGAEAPRLALPSATHAPVPVQRLVAFPGRGLSAPPPPQTGPPLLA